MTENMPKEWSNEALKITTNFHLNQNYFLQRDTETPKTCVWK